MTFNSYSQNLEDVILGRVLKDVTEGFYIDAGAFDPNLDSVTKAFYELGWTGINVEPVRNHFEKFLADRSKDINLQYLLSSSEEEIDFFEMHDGGLSTAVESIVYKHKLAGFSFEKQKKKTHTLSKIIDQFAQGKELHFLKVDVEGFELEVLRGMDFKKHRPWVLVIESTYPLTQEQNFESWEHIILRSDYSFVYFDGLNRFYLANEHEGLKSRFGLPPNVFDNYLSHRSAKTGEFQALESQLKEHQVYLSQLREELVLIKNSKSWRLSLLLSRIYHLLRKGEYGIKLLKGDLRAFLKSYRWRKFESVRLENLVPPEMYQLTYSQRPASRLDWKSEVISEKRFTETNFFLWMNLLRDVPRLHSKQFQNYAIMEAANSILELGKGDVKAMGFGVGIEPIPAGLAKLGFDVLATDYLDSEIASEWKNTDQLVSSPEDLNARGILTESEFISRVKFMNMDMNKIPPELNDQFDFVWSSCALGHIGGYQNGLDFILRSVKLLKPGGIALHTTELDVSPGESRFESPTLSLYREKDLNALIKNLNSEGYQVDHFSNVSNWDGESERFIDREPWGERPHIRIQVLGREVLSLVLRIHRPR
jgi:FkbM family methyltransferase